VSIGGAECGTINTATKNGQWYTVKCARPLRGDKVTLETTQNDYLSISGIEVYTATCTSGCGGTSGFKPVTQTSTSMPMRRMPMGMGGFPGGMKVSFSHTGNKVTFANMTQGPKYSNDHFPASNVLANGSKFTHTTAKIGAYWKADF
jgi:hypothetical protein